MNPPRIKITHKENETTIEIFPVQDAFKSRILLVWLVVWTLCGIIVFSQFFSNMSREEKLLMAVWMAFWAYFEFKITSVYAWRKNGSERIVITPEQFIYSSLQSQKVIKKEYYLENLSDLEMYEFGKNNFTDSFQTSYWVKGNESIFFTNFGAKIGFGFQLNKEEAAQVFQAIHKKIKRKK